jgi:hypothetical protein
MELVAIIWGWAPFDPEGLSLTAKDVFTGMILVIHTVITSMIHSASSEIPWRPFPAKKRRKI